MSRCKKIRGVVSVSTILLTKPMQTCLSHQSIGFPLRQITPQLMCGLRGIAGVDKGYIDKKLEEKLSNQGLRLITKVRKNMRKRMLSAFEKFFLYQRNIIETVIDQLKSICHIEYSRHRSPMDFLVNIVSGLTAYTLKPRKPAIKISKLPKTCNALIHN